MKVVSPSTTTLITKTSSSAASSPTGSLSTVRYLGRVNPATKELTWPGTGVSFTFTGTMASIGIASISGTNSADLVIDGGAPIIIANVDGPVISTPSALAYGTHTVSLRKRSETDFGSIFLGNITTDGTLIATPAPARLIELIGDSITVGYGLDGVYPCTNTAALEDNQLTDGVLAAQSLGADYSVVAWSGKGIVRNYESTPPDDSLLVPELWTRYGANDADNSYTFPTDRIPQAVVINLGTNDFGYLGVRDELNVTLYTNAMVQFVKTIQTHYPNAQFFLQSSPLLGDSYPTVADAQHTTESNALKAAVAQIGSTAHFVDWPSQGSNVGCDYHPSAATNAAEAPVLAAAISSVLNPMASKQRSFFDKKPIAVPKGWNGQNRYPYDHKSTAAIPPPPRKVMPALTTISDASRNKLKAFAFVAKEQSDVKQTSPGRAVGEAEKENRDAGRGNDGGSQSLQKSQSQRIGFNDGGNDGWSHCPQTPLGRVPLRDLLHNDAAVFDDGPSMSPEVVVWNHSVESQMTQDPLMTPAPRRGKRKSRSFSTSASSSQEKSSQKRLATLALEQTPQISHLEDPAKKMWTDYSKNIGTPYRNPTAAFLLDFLNSSSPPCRPGLAEIETSRDSFQRSISCGNEWPTSVAKRRKLEKSSTQKAEPLYVKDPNGPETPPVEKKPSRRDQIVERLFQQHAVMESSSQRKAAPSSSSPLAPGPSQADDSSLYPLERQLTDQRSSPPSRGTTPLEDELVLQFSQANVATELPSVGIGLGAIVEEFVEGGEQKDSRHKIEEFTAPHKPKLSSSSSEYGGDDSDLELMLEAAASIEAAPLTEGVVLSPKDDTEIDVFQTAPAAISDQEHAQEQEFRSDPGLGEAAPADDRFLPGNVSTAQTATTRDISGMANPVQHIDEPDEHDEFDMDDDMDDEFERIASALDQDLTSLPLVQEVETRAVFAEKVIDEAPLDDGATMGDVAKMPTVPVVHELSSDDEFGDDEDFGDLADEFMLATQNAMNGSNAAPVDTHPSTIQRYLIVSITEGTFKTERGAIRPEKVLFVEEERTRQKRSIILRQSWYDSPCTPGSYVHILGDFDTLGMCIVNDAKNILILHPDHLISATVVADSFTCVRRAVLQDRVKATSEPGEAQVYGQILHAVFQEAMTANNWDIEWLFTVVQKHATGFLEKLFEINVEYEFALNHLMSKMPELIAWANLFVRAEPLENAYVKDRNGSRAIMSINKLLDVEEHVWSPMYGLKGNIDATVQARVKEDNEIKTLVVPLEVKTGHSNQTGNHQAQTALYTLLLSDRYDVQVSCGILYYSESSETSRIRQIPNELRGMIQKRNELATFVRHRLELPPMLRNPHTCSKCYAKTTCFMYHKLVDDGDGNTSRAKEKFEEIVGHLGLKHQEFFRNWDSLLTKEESDLVKFKRELWTMLSTEREKVGRCFSNVIIEAGSARELWEGSKTNRFQYSLIKKVHQPGFFFTESQITIGEPIVISDEKGHFALANGYITHIRKKRVTVAVDRRLHNARQRSKRFDSERHQSFSGIMEVRREGNQEVTSQPDEPEEEVVYRLDKDEFSNGMATVRSNLIRVMEKGVFAAQSLRRLIIEDVAPRFESSIKSNFLSTSASQTLLNVDQRNAVKKVLSAKDYALVLGMPGTGKTTTIARLIRALLADGKSIVLTSYTHTAVDNILLKLRNLDASILRIGAVAKVHPEVQTFVDLAEVPKINLDELKRTYNAQIVATTCLGIGHPIFSRRVFDYCIVDEASQITLPVCLGPIRMAKTFILVGDHFQLPPLVQNKEAQEGGLDISLFKLLSDRHPESVVTLEHQYRMCADIMSLSNTLIYSGRLKCGTEEVASREIAIPNMSAMQNLHFPTSSHSSKQICRSASEDGCFLTQVLLPAAKVCFLNTDPLLPEAADIASGARVTNPIEAALTAQLVESLITVGIAPTDIGVITLYRSQLALIRQNLRHRTGAGGSNSSMNGVGNLPTGDGASGAVEMHTADRFQGRDKEVIILSLVRSNDAGNVGDLLKDWRRVNVALTRARTKLLIVGGLETMRKGNELLKKFVELLEGKDWVKHLHKGCLDEHWFASLVSGTSGLTQATGYATGRAEHVIRDVAKDAAPGDEGEADEKSSTRLGQKESRAIGGVRSCRGIINPADEKENKVSSHGSAKQKGPGKMRVPAKVQGMDPKTLLGKRPVLRDIINEAS
ncbi:Tripartite DNA replication factor [Agyrium rufum]|nr:Tripartite DNA replication factor [Agyrium rufum]